jgi:hypothetical protein
MRRRLGSRSRQLGACRLVAVTVTLLGVEAAVRAQQLPPGAMTAAPETSVVTRPGLDFGLRLGYAMPMGEIFPGASFSPGISGAVPLLLEAGVRFTPAWTAGAFFQYALAQTGGCGNGSTCSANVVRAGVQALHNLGVGTSFDPWVGAGIGYEWLNTSVVSGAIATNGTYRGLEFVTLQGGADHRLARRFVIGPFVSL